MDGLSHCEGGNELRSPIFAAEPRKELQCQMKCT
jgi:hypothetical protein